MRFLLALLLLLPMGPLSCGVADHYAEAVQQAAFRPDWTEEALTLTVTPGAGGLRAVAPGLKLTKQNHVDAHGAFGSVKDALDVLPQNIRHIVTISIAAGSYTIADDFFGDFSRFTYATPPSDSSPNASVGIAIAGAGWERVPNTPTLAVATVDSHYQATLEADPGFAADQYVGSFVAVEAGGGVFSPTSVDARIVTRHSTTAWQFAGSALATTGAWNTSTVLALYQNKTTLTFATTTSVAIYGSQMIEGGSYVSFQALNINATAAKLWSFFGVNAAWSGVRTRYLRFSSSYGNTGLGFLSMDGVSGNTSNIAYAVASAQSGTIGLFTSSPILRYAGDCSFFRNFGTALSLVGSPTGRGAFLFRTTVRDVTTGLSAAAIGNSPVRVDTNNRSDTVAGYYINASYGTWWLSKAWFISNSSQAPTQNFLINETSKTWADLDAETTYVDTMYGSHGASVSYYP